jgi:hypothetical protein
VRRLSSLDPAASSAPIDDTHAHGFVVVEARDDALRATYYLIDADQVGNDYYSDPTTLQALFETRAYTVKDGVLTRE